jgi:hypothetical protein
MEVGGQDVRPDSLEERRKRLARLLSRNTKAVRDGIQLSEAITGDGAAIFRHACGLALEGFVSQRHWLPLRERPDACMAEDEEPEYDQIGCRPVRGSRRIAVQPLRNPSCDGGPCPVSLAYLRP